MYNVHGDVIGKATIANFESQERVEPGVLISMVMKIVQYGPVVDE